MKRILYIIGIIIFFLPSVVKAQYISADPATGVISACVGTASSSPNIQQITVSGGLLSSDVVVTAPNNFEVSLAGTGGFGNSITLPSTGGAVFFGGYTVFVCAAASAAAGSISGYVMLVSGAVTQKKV